MSLCVYAIVPGRARVRGTGLAGERLRVVRAGGIAAVVGEQSRRPPVSPAGLIAYDHVLQRVADRTATIVPARFGTRVADEAELEMVLRARRRSLQQALTHVRNRAQMTVRLVIDEPSRGEARVARGGEDAASSGTSYLRSRAEAAAMHRDVQGFAPLRPAVSRWIRDERIERRGRLATVYHLVPRASAAAYRRALQRAAQAHEVPVTVGGPWLPYAFVSPEAGLGV